MDIEEIVHMLYHVLTEETIGAQLDTAKSQKEVYDILCTLPYFTLTIEEFRQGLDHMRQESDT